MRAGGPLQEQLHGSLEGFHSLSSDEGQTWMGFRILPAPNSKALLSVPTPKNQSHSGPLLGQH